MIDLFGSEYNFGFLGEAYIESEKLENLIKQAPEIIERYFSIKKPYHCNRNSSYYSTELKTATKYIETCPGDIRKILSLEINQKTKKYILFSIMNHLISNLSKIIGLVFSVEKLRVLYLENVKEYMQLSTDYFVSTICDCNTESFPNIDTKVVFGIVDYATLNGIVKVREYSEMDHPLLLVNSYFAYEEFIKENDVILAPLQGGCVIPPMYISLFKQRLKSGEPQKNVSFDFMKFSTYDTEDFNDIPLHKQVETLGEKYDRDANILLIDDNTGTATTIKKLKSELERVFNNITTGVIECRWDTKIVKSDYSAFNMNDIDIITPLCYRHFRRFAEEIEYIKNECVVNNEYIKGAFYKLELAFDKFDFDEFLQSSEITKSNQKRLMTVINNYKGLSEVGRVR